MDTITRKMRVERSQVTLPPVEPIAQPDLSMSNNIPPTYKSRHRFSFRFKWTWKTVLLAIIALGLICGGYVFYKGVITIKEISSGNDSIFNLFTKSNADSLKSDGNGRTNILLLGNGGANHPGGNLTDTMIIASFDTKNNQLALISIPRDLYVSIPGNGKGKINSAFSKTDKKSKKAGAELVSQTLKDNLDVDIHYYIRGDFDAFEKVIDLVGGVTINVQKAIYDPYFPDDRMVGYAPFKIAAGVQQMNGKTALKYARSRETTSDFDRSRRQQEILIALKDKLISAQTLSNPKKVLDIMEVLGKHINTDLGTTEFKYLAETSGKYSKTVTTKVFDTTPEGGLVSAATDAGYSLLPKGGSFDAMSKDIKDIFLTATPSPSTTTSSNPSASASASSSSQTATITIYNATGKANAFATETKALESNGFTIKTQKSIATISKSSLVKTTTKKTTAENYLEKYFGLTASSSSNTTSSEFILTLGSDYVAH